MLVRPLVNTLAVRNAEPSLSRTRALSICVLGLALCASVGVVGQQPDANDKAVVHAVIEDFVWKEVVRFNRPQDGPPQLALATETLARCDFTVQPVIPCLSDEVLQVAGREAAMGRWSTRLREALATRNAKPAGLPQIDYAGLVMGVRLEVAKAFPHARNMSVSLPAYAENQALVYVQWGHQWSGLLLLTRTQDGWRVTDQEVVSVS